MRKKNIFTALLCAVAISTVSVFSTLAVTNAANNEVTYKSQGRIVYESPDGNSAKNVVFDASDFNTISNLVTSGKMNVANSINTYSSDAANPIINTIDANGNQYIPTFQELADAITGMTQSDNSKFKEQTAASETLGYGASRTYQAGYYPNSWTVTGKNPSGTKTITSNGTYDIKDYSSVSVSVNSSSGGSDITTILDSCVNESMNFGDTATSFSVTANKYYMILRYARQASVDPVPTLTGANIVSTVIRKYIPNNGSGGNIAISLYLIKSTSNTITIDKSYCISDFTK